MLDKAGDVVHYKSGVKKGQVRTVKTNFIDHIRGIMNDVYKDPHDKIYTDTNTDEKRLLSLCKIARKHRCWDVVHTIEDIIKLRKTNKDLTTYYEGLKKHVWTDTSIIHPNYNHAIAATKRLTSSSPNMQNISNKSTETGTDGD